MMEDRVPVVIPPSGLAGVYYLHWRGKLVYIGKSINVYYRIAKHYANMQRRRRGLARSLHNIGDALYLDFDRVEVEFCSVDALAFNERQAIKKYRPLNNIMMNSDPPEGLDAIQETEWFKELEKIADRANPKVKKRRLSFNGRFVARNPRSWRQAKEVASA